MNNQETSKIAISDKKQRIYTSYSLYLILIKFGINEK